MAGCTVFSLPADVVAAALPQDQLPLGLLLRCIDAGVESLPTG